MDTTSEVETVKASDGDDSSDSKFDMDAAMAR